MKQRNGSTGLCTAAWSRQYNRVNRSACHVVLPVSAIGLATWYGSGTVLSIVLSVVLCNCLLPGWGRQTPPNTDTHTHVRVTRSIQDPYCSHRTSTLERPLVHPVRETRHTTQLAAPSAHQHTPTALARCQVYSLSGTAHQHTDRHSTGMSPSALYTSWAAH